MLVLDSNYILENKDTLLFALEFVFNQGDEDVTTKLDVGTLSQLDFRGVYLGYNYRLWVFDSRVNEWEEVDRKLYLSLISRKTVQNIGKFTLATYANPNGTETEIWCDEDYITRTHDGLCNGKLSVDIAKQLIAGINTVL